MVVGADDVAERGEALFYALDLDGVGDRVAQVLELLVGRGGGDEEAFSVSGVRAVSARAFMRFVYNRLELQSSGSDFKMWCTRRTQQLICLLFSFLRWSHDKWVLHLVIQPRRYCASFN